MMLSKCRYQTWAKCVCAIVIAFAGDIALSDQDDARLNEICPALFSSVLDPGIKSALLGFTFERGSFRSTSDRKLRVAIYEAFNGVDFYTQQKISFSEMVIDHVVPRSAGGPDSYFNYVITNRTTNAAKLAKADPVAVVGTLAIVRTVYAPRVKAILEKIAEEEALTAKPRRLGVSRPIPKNSLPRPPVNTIDFMKGLSLESRELLVELFRRFKSRKVSVSSPKEVVFESADFDRVFPLLAKLKSESVIRTSFVDANARHSWAGSASLIGEVRAVSSAETKTIRVQVGDVFEEKIRTMSEVEFSLWLDSVTSKSGAPSSR